MARFGGGVHLISPTSAVAERETETAEFEHANEEQEGVRPRDSLQGDDHDDTHHAIRYSFDEADVKANVARSTLMIVAPTISEVDDIEGTLGPVRGPRILDKSRWNQVRINRYSLGFLHTPRASAIWQLSHESSRDDLPTNSELRW